MAKIPAGYTLRRVRIWNRQDCCGERLRDAKIIVDGKTCGTVPNKAPPIYDLNIATSSACMYIVTGGSSYIKVELPRNDYLQICELKLWGSDANGGHGMGVSYFGGSYGATDANGVDMVSIVRISTDLLDLLWG